MKQLRQFKFEINLSEILRIYIMNSASKPLEDILISDRTISKSHQNKNYKLINFILISDPEHSDKFISFIITCFVFIFVCIYIRVVLNFEH